ncbi:casein kinase substrate phosphoprotein PP28-domain-containing protein [Ganoderma leucocontextum]|nr:casein kinase substrate phosphoprotein PP28-domain-containing protein [Ganoderma leucocontextum]
MKKKKTEAAQAKKQANGEEEDVGEDGEPVLVNPNHSAGKRMNLSDLSAPRELSRKEREEKEKKEAKERYWKLHAAGQTDEAKADLARLAKIRAEREAAQAKRKAEAEVKAAEADQKRKEQMAKKRT